MAAETATKGVHAEEEEKPQQPQGNYEEGEGYAGVALDIVASSQGEPREIVANVPNRGAVPGMRDDDVVEVVCRSGPSGLNPVPMDSVPEDALLLMRQVKRYERLTVQAVRTHSRECAVEALMEHPLVGSYSLSRSLVDAYLDAHQTFVGEWAA
jgi:6-phospho-beta-glucosidase